MKPVLEHLSPEKEESFFAESFDFPYFGTPWHYHPEFELVLILESHGKRLIGTNVSNFQKNDLTFLGPNLPHIYKNPEAYYAQGSALRARSIVIHFLEKSLGLDFLALPQTHKIIRLFELSKQGMDITGKTKEQVILKMKHLLQVKGMDRLICLLNILNQLANTTEYNLISRPGIIGHNQVDAERLNRIFQFMLQNFSRRITLEEVADLVCMTRTSFCRFFQEHTKRTFSSYLTDIRLSHASKLLRESTSNIAQISYECGYSNLSNFNRQFKHNFLLTPKEYRNRNCLLPIIRS